MKFFRKLFLPKKAQSYNQPKIVAGYLPASYIRAGEELMKSLRAKAEFKNLGDLLCQEK